MKYVADWLQNRLSAKFGSNIQPFVNKRDVKDGEDEDLTQEPEMIKAFRDTWELGIHDAVKASCSYTADRSRTYEIIDSNNTHVLPVLPTKSASLV